MCAEVVQIYMNYEVYPKYSDRQVLAKYRDSC